MTYKIHLSQWHTKYICHNDIQNRDALERQRAVLSKQLLGKAGSLSFKIRFWAICTQWWVIRPPRPHTTHFGTLLPRPNPSRQRLSQHHQQLLISLAHRPKNRKIRRIRIIRKNRKNLKKRLGSRSPVFFVVAGITQQQHVTGLMHTQKLSAICAGTSLVIFRRLVSTMVLLRTEKSLLCQKTKIGCTRDQGHTQYSFILPFCSKACLKSNF